MADIKSITDSFDYDLRLLKCRSYMEAQAILDNTPVSVCIDEEVKQNLFKILNRNITDDEVIFELLINSGLEDYMETLIDLIKHFGYRVGPVFGIIEVLLLHKTKGLKNNPVVEVHKHIMTRKEFYIWSGEYFKLTPPSLMGIHHWVSLE